MRFTVLYLLLLSSGILEAQKKYYMTTNWLFTAGDSMSWAESDYPDYQWKKLDAGKSWQQSGFSHTGYGWYRYHLVIPKSLKASIRSKGFMKINCGYANEAAQYFFNGRGLGQSGSLPPRFIKASLSHPVEFYISEDEIKWDTLNIISIRVFSTDSINSGIIKGPLYYYVPLKLE